MIRISKYADMKSEDIFSRGTRYADVAPVVADIIENVRQNGDGALRE